MIAAEFTAGTAKSLTTAPAPATALYKALPGMCIAYLHKYVKAKTRIWRDHATAFIFNIPTSSTAILLCSVQGWHTAVKPVFEVVSLERKALGASVPLPKTVIRYILSAVLPRVLQRKLLGLLPQELGQYMLDAGQAGRLAGHLLPAWQLTSWKTHHACHVSGRIRCL